MRKESCWHPPGDPVHFVAVPGRADIFVTGKISVQEPHGSLRFAISFLGGVGWGAQRCWCVLSWCRPCTLVKFVPTWFLASVPAVSLFFHRVLLAVGYGFRVLFHTPSPCGRSPLLWDFCSQFSCIFPMNTMPAALPLADLLPDHTPSQSAACLPPLRWALQIIRMLSLRLTAANDLHCTCILYSPLWCESVCRPEVRMRCPRSRPCPWCAHREIAGVEGMSLGSAVGTTARLCGTWGGPGQGSRAPVVTTQKLLLRPQGASFLQMWPVCVVLCVAILQHHLPWGPSPGCWLLVSFPPPPWRPSLAVIPGTSNVSQHRPSGCIHYALILHLASS